MDIRRNPEPGKTAVLWLATVFVVVIGAAACAFIIVSAVERPSEQLFFWGGVFGAVIMVLLVMAFRRDKTFGNVWLTFWASTRTRNPKNVLRIGRKKSAKPEYGTNTPPTLESVREAADQNASWVPHGAPPDRSRPH